MEEPTLIPYFDLRRRHRETQLVVEKAIAGVLESGVYIGGFHVERFERDFANYIGVEQCVGVGNGLDALRLILIGLGIGPGDEVLVPAQTFIATWLAVVQVGATPVGVDVLAESDNMDPDCVLQHVTSRTSAMIVVHLHGQLADVKRLGTIASQLGIPLIEDAAQAHGASDEMAKAGAMGTAAAFSFYPTKNLGAVGDAGAVTTNDTQLAARIRSLRSYGASATSKYHHDVPGWNTRMDPLQAVVLSAFLPLLDGWNERRRIVASAYLDLLKGNERLRPLEATDQRQKSVWHHFVVRAVDRDRVRDQLSRCGILTEVHYPEPPFASRAMRSVVPNAGAAAGSYPVARAMAQGVLSLPLHPWVGDDLPRILEALAGVDK